MGKKIKLEKIDDGEEEYEAIPGDDEIEKMSVKVSGLCGQLMKPKEEFDFSGALAVLVEFAANDKRILYSQVTNVIFSCYEKNSREEASVVIDNITSNLTSMIEQTRTDEFEAALDPQGVYNKSPQELRAVIRKILIKLWDHTNLAERQYNQLKQTDEEFNDKFQNHFQESFNKQFEDASNKRLNDFAKDMNAQLLTLVGIFTALAFLIFGSITGLSDLVTNINESIPRLMILGCIWGLAVLNLVFVFLFCVGKMIGTRFASTDDPKATIWEKYPIVWWSDFAIGSILLISMWLYYLKNRKGLAIIDKLLINHPAFVVCGGSLLIIGIIIAAFFGLNWATKIVHKKKK